MRRNLAAVAAAAVLATPLLLAAASPAAAATNTLTLTTIDRNGVSVKTTATALNVANNFTYSVPTGKTVSLPKATYAILVDIMTGYASDTVAGRVITVSGSTKLTLDARGGHAVKVAMSPALPADYVQRLDARICGPNSWFTNIEAYNTAGNLYVLPSTSKLLTFAYLSTWQPSFVDQSVSYVVAGKVAAVPSNPSFTAVRSKLARMDISVRHGPSLGQAADIALQPNTNDCEQYMFTSLDDESTPFATTAYMSPTQWLIRGDTEYTAPSGETDVIGGLWKTRTLAAGGVYSQIYNHAVWGPALALPQVFSGSLYFDTAYMFHDPGFDDAWYSSEAAERSTAVLTRGSTTLANRVLTDWGNDNSGFSYKLGSAGWYTLDVTANRYRPGITFPADLLSPKSRATFHFYADPKKSVVAPVYLTRFTPFGLDASNRAAPGSTTKVGLVLERMSQTTGATLGSAPISSVSAQYSTDGGTTWHPVAVAHSGSSRWLMVPNPASGMVTLRATVTDGKGASAQITVYRAYAVG